MSTFKLNQQITLKDNSVWVIVKIFNPKQIKDRTYKMLHNSALELEYTLKGQYSTILMSESGLIKNLSTNSIQK